MKRQKKSIYFLVSCIVGILLSCYALFIELKTEEDKGYKAFCDINEYISCTKAFSSRYGKGFGIVGLVLGHDSIFNQPNSLYGIIFYLILGMLSCSENNALVNLQLALTVISNFFSVYLAFILYYILQDFCMICVGTYVVNALNLVLSALKWRELGCGISVPKKIKKIKKKNE